MQHLGLLSMLLLISGLTLTALKLPGGLHTTFSQRVAHRQKAKLLYSLLFIVGLPLLFWFFADWLVPVRGLSGLFLWVAAISMIFQIACTFVPEEDGTKTVIHRLLTGISGVALLPLMVIIIATQTIPTGLRYVTAAALVLMLILLGIALANQKEYRYALLLQIGYYALFFLMILLVTYI